MAFLSRYRLWLGLTGGLLALYALLGFVGVPFAVTRYVIPSVAETLRHPVLLGGIAFNPFTCTIQLTDFEIQQQDGTPMVGFHELFVNFEATSLVRSAYQFDEIRLTLPYGLLRIQPDGKLNLLGLVPPQPDQAEAPPPVEPKDRRAIPLIEIRELGIHQGVLEFRDETKRRPVAIDVVPIEVTLRNFSTRQGGENAYAFTAEFGQGETLAWEGTLLLDPLESHGKFALSNVKLATFWPSVREQFRFDLTGGAVTVSGNYRFDTNGTPVNFQLSDGRFLLADFSLNEPGDPEPLIAFPSFLVERIDVDLSKRDVGVGVVRLTAPRIRGWREPDGAVNFARLFAPAEGRPTPPADAKPTPPAETGEPVRPWTVLLKEAVIEQGGVAFEDRSVKTPAELTIDDLAVSLKEVQVPLRGAMPLSVSLRVNQTGEIDAKGTVRLDKPAVDLSLSLSHIALRPFQPYLDGVVQAEVTDGEVELFGDVTFRSKPESEPMLRYRGKLGVNNLHVWHRPSDQEMLSWTSLGLKNVLLDVEPTNVKIGEIALKDAAVQLVVAKDGAMNVSNLMVQQDKPAGPAPASPEPASPKRPAAGPTPIVIDTITLSKLAATFTDDSIEPRVATGIYGLSGAIKGLSSKDLAKADVSLTGTVDNVAPVKIQGKINPLSGDAYTDIKVLFQGVDLTVASPYAGKYVGFPLTKGKLSLDLKYELSQKHLSGENKVLVDQLTFGEKTDSPDATSLPVRLAVALLKDRRGRIDIDLPVRGDLNEPDFRYGRMLLNTLVNVVTKVATSPFAALGGLVGGGGDDLQYMEFEPGVGELAQGEHAKLASLAKALEERPALRLEISGSADPKKDRDALALHKIAEELKRRFTQGGKKNLQAALPKERELELLGDLYAEKLGKQATKSEVLPNGKTVVRVLEAEAMQAELVPAMTVDEDELRELARTRAKAVREDLVAQNKVPEDRVFLVEVEVAKGEQDKIRMRLNLTGK
ncbi:MAG: DUF748 domain-containing protein [Nitrospiraceae bacterium]|nr:DUF748 domain-containing protein [Nitrospiraceae bacterium]